MSFCTKNDEKYLASVADNLKVIIWEWDKGRDRAVSDVSGIFKQLNLMYFHPMDDSVMFVGKGNQNVVVNNLIKYLLAQPQGTTPSRSRNRRSSSP